MKRKHNIRHIKENYPYLIYEVCILLGVHKNTVLRWIKKEGLKTIDGKKPFLIHGSDLKEFLKKRQDARQSKCKDDELFCTTCKKPQKPFGMLIDIFMYTKNRGNLQGICSVCDRKIYRVFGIKKFDLVKKVFDVGKVHNSHLIECFNSTCNGDFNQQ